MVTTYVIFSLGLPWLTETLVFGTASEKFINPAVYLILGFGIFWYTWVISFAQKFIGAYIYLHPDDIAIDPPLDVADRLILGKTICCVTRC